MMHDEIIEFRKIVLTSDSLAKLYDVDIELENMKGDLFKIRDANHDEVDVMAKISMVSKLQDICGQRQKDLKETARINANQDQQVNYNFVRNAPYYIPKETFDKIMESAKMPRHEWKRKMENEGKLEKVKSEK